MGVYSSVKNTAAGMKLAYNITVKETYPWFINFRITYRCNYRCHYCDSPSKRIKEMSTEQVRQMIFELSELGMRKIAFSGGEPTLRKDLGELVTFAKECGVFTNVVTNGSLYKEKAEELKDVDYMVFSLDGSREMNDKVRGEGSFDKVIESIKIAKSLGKKINVISVVTKDSIKDIDEILELGERLEFGVLFQPVSEYALATDEQTIAKLRSDEEAHKRAMDHILKRQKEGYHILYSNHHYEYLKNAFQVENRRECKYKGRFFASINSDGRVAACTPKDLEDHWINGCEVGWKKALQHVPSFKCEGCFSSWLEIDDLSAKRPAVVSYWLRNKSHIMNT